MQAIGTETMIEIVSDDIFSSSFSSIIEKEMRELKKKRDPANFIIRCVLFFCVLFFNMSIRKKSYTRDGERSIIFGHVPIECTDISAV